MFNKILKDIFNGKNKILTKYILVYCTIIIDEDINYFFNEINIPLN